ncbi:MAG: S41 family peptidase [Lachnospiraceae bacterium]|nr:S41 family peptidase [Lachnospiraceae bacterium]
MKLSRRFAAFIIALALAFGAVGCGRTKMVVENTTTENTTNEVKDTEVVTTEVDTMRGSDVVGKDTNNKLEKIQNILNENFYFEEDEQAKQDGLIKGYMEGLDDPYSVYYTRDEYAEFMEDTEGEYVGVGVQVSQNVDTKVITVVKVFDGSPAKEAGIEAQDVISEVDGEDVGEQELDAVVDKIRGVEGTDVKITVYRRSDGKDHEYTMKRRKVENPTVEYKMLSDNIGYIAVSSFYEVTANQFIDAVGELNVQGMEGLIVDLRDNGGGLLDIAVEMLDFMLPEGKIVYTKDKDGNIIESYNSTAEQQFTKPLVLLVNGYSASASEIFAGAIKDYGIGTLVGTTTYGKGIVQRLFPLEDGSAVKVTIAKYFTPNGNDIHKVGIEPDVEVEFDSVKYKDSDGEEDNQLDAAVNEMLKKLGKSSKTTTTTDTNASEPEKAE